MLPESIDTLIIGAGQAGLATSYCLREKGIEHIVLEQTPHAGSHWRERLWDSFTLVTPNWTVKLPGGNSIDVPPNDFMNCRDVAAMLQRYADHNELPIQYQTQVQRIAPDAQGFGIQTSRGHIRARQVVVAMGLFQAPRLPDYASQIPPAITQLHSSAYKNPQQLPPGAVLVVGSSQSGAQIAEELLAHGRQVFLCVGKSGRAPRNYRGHDGSYWLDRLGVSDQLVDTLPSPRAKFAANPHIKGRLGGKPINLHLFAQEGMKLLGQANGWQDGKLQIAPDLHENLAFADAFETGFTKRIDQFIVEQNLDCPAQELPQWRNGYDTPILTELDLMQQGIHTIVWAAGYSWDFSLIECDIFDADGYPRQKRGVTEQPGLYFVGLPWLHKQRSGLLSGVGDDASYIAEQIAQHAAQYCY